MSREFHLRFNEVSKYRMLSNSTNSGSSSLTSDIISRVLAIPFTDFIIIVCVVGFIILVLFICLIISCRRRSNRKVIYLDGKPIGQTKFFDFFRSMTEMTSKTKQKDKYTIPWSDIIVYGKTSDEVIIGEGSFGSVIRAVYQHQGKSHDVVVKVMTKAIVMSQSLTLSGNRKSAYDHLYDSARSEMMLMKRAEEKMVIKNCIVKVFGIVSGNLPEHLTAMFNLPQNTDIFGLVMKFEGGGTLSSLIHKGRDKEPNKVIRSQPVDPANVLPMAEKIRYLTSIARGLAELHAAGIIHADIKSENILLSTDSPPQPKLADFGLSFLRSDDGSGSSSSLQMTSHFRGTPVYCAPEMLFNPYAEQEETSDAVTENAAVLAKPSRKTDVYAFAVLCWEVLSQLYPFNEVRNETELSAKIHQGHRPPIEQLPAETPSTVVRMIEYCWDADRSKRKSAIECFSILQHQEMIHTRIMYDVYISHDGSLSQVMVSHIFHRFAQQGIRAYYHGKSLSTKRIRIELPGRRIAIRAGPKITYKPLSYLTSGSEIEVFSKPTGGFYKLVDGNGYVNTKIKDAKYIEIDTSSGKTKDIHKSSSSESQSGSPRESLAGAEPVGVNSREISDIRANIARSQIFLACISRQYEDNSTSMSELREARRRTPPLSVIVLYMDENSKDWLSQEIMYLCQLRSRNRLEIDMSKILRMDDWSKEDGPSSDALSALNDQVDVITKYLKE